MVKKRKRIEKIVIKELNIYADLEFTILDSWVIPDDDGYRSINTLGILNEKRFINIIEYIGKQNNIPIITQETIRDCNYLEALEYCKNNLKKLVQNIKLPKNNPSIGHQITAFLFRWLDLNKNNYDVFLFNHIDLGLNPARQFWLNREIREIVGDDRHKQIIYYTHSYEISRSLCRSMVILKNDWKKIKELKK